MAVGEAIPNFFLKLHFCVAENSLVGRMSRRTSALNKDRMLIFEKDTKNNIYIFDNIVF
jgi:hypothetical protein